MRQFQIKYNNCDSTCLSWSIFTNNAAETEQLKMGYSKGPPNTLGLLVLFNQKIFVLVFGMSAKWALANFKHDMAFF